MFLEEYREIKVLCVEDEELIRENQVDYLKRFFDEVFEASNAYDALDLVEQKKPELIITDIEMSDMNGLEMIRSIREHDKKTKIIVLSAYSNKEYLLDAIDLELVKYLIKPIDHENFYPILVQCSKEIQKEYSKKIQLCEQCNFDMKNLKLQVQDQSYKLSKYEADFLLLLYENKPNVVNYDQIQYHVWADNIMSGNSLRTLVKSLRKKLPTNMITNLSKVGYKFEEL